MALVTLAVVGRDNEPLYIRDFVAPNKNVVSSPKIGDEEKQESEDQESVSRTSVDIEELEDDPFGFFEYQSKNINESCSMTHQFVIHSALDRFEEITALSIGQRWRTPGATGTNAMWVGLLCPIDDMKIYGYLTNTGIKIMAAINDIGNANKQWSLAREGGLKGLFANMHELYVEYTLNPFSIIREKISSARFDHGVDNLVQEFNEAYGSKELAWM